jgi:1-hydroxycarotenoid 3,4-desaturase
LHDPRLQQLFGRYATYCGGSPWLAPATLMLVAHVEQQGVWSVTAACTRWRDRWRAGRTARRPAALRHRLCRHRRAPGPRVSGVRCAAANA